MAILRVVILGCAGTGKTTLARILSQEFDVPAVIMDELWVGRIRPEDVPSFRAKFIESLPDQGYITDGNYAIATFDLRIPHSTHILWLEASRLSSIARACARLVKPGEWHTIRELFMVLRYIWSFDRVNRPRILSELEKYEGHPPITYVRMPSDLENVKHQLRHFEHVAARI